MFGSALKFFLTFVVSTVLASAVSGQIIPPTDPFSRDDRTKEEQPKSIREQLSKRRIEQERKDHEEILSRGEEALKISKKLEVALNEKSGFDRTDIEDLEALEKLVSKIRKELGGDSDKETEEKVKEEIGNTQDVKAAFGYLRTSTIKLVDELKKTTRFSISAAAIQTSNTVITIARFLRLRR
jgi:hypothetical protein